MALSDRQRRCAQLALDMVHMGVRLVAEVVNEMDRGAGPDSTGSPADKSRALDHLRVAYGLDRAGQLDLQILVETWSVLDDARRVILLDHAIQLRSAERADPEERA